MMLLPAESPEEAIAREAVAQWMIKHSYPTGHGDTLNDLLLELAGQARSRPTRCYQLAEQKQ